MNISEQLLAKLLFSVVIKFTSLLHEVKVHIDHCKQSTRGVLENSCSQLLKQNVSK